MRKLFPAALLCAAIGAALIAQQTRKTREAHACRFETQQRRSAGCLRDYGNFQRVVVLRFKYQTDLLAGIEKMVKEQNIRNAVILSAVGSVRNYQVHTVSNRTFPSKDTFVQDPTAPADLVSMNGYIIDGRVHAHMMLANPDRAFGGHSRTGHQRVYVRHRYGGRVRGWRRLEPG